MTCRRTGARCSSQLVTMPLARATGPGLSRGRTLAALCWRTDAMCGRKSRTQAHRLRFERSTRRPGERRPTLGGLVAPRAVGVSNTWRVGGGPGPPN